MEASRIDLLVTLTACDAVAPCVTATVTFDRPLIYIYMSAFVSNAFPWIVLRCACCHHAKRPGHDGECKVTEDSQQSHS